MSNIEKVNDFLNKAKVYTFLTTDGFKPKGRPLGFHVFYNNKLYFGVGNHKDVYQQILKNPYVEIVATVDGQFMRYDGKVKFVEEDSVLAELERKQNQIMYLYDKNGWKMQLFVLEEGHVEFKGMMSTIEEFDL